MMTAGGQIIRASLRAALDEMAASLPARAVTVSHRPKIDQYELFPGLPAVDLEVSFGDGWGELNALSSEFQLDFDKDPDSLDWFLAICDAVREGRVWDLRARSGGRTRTVYRLQSRGVSQLLRDTGYNVGWFLSRGPRRQRYAAWPSQEAA